MGPAQLVPPELRQRASGVNLWTKLRSWWAGTAPSEDPDPRLQLMHWSPDRMGLAWCGARRGARWTIDLDYVSCVICRQQGRLLQDQWLCNIR